MENWRDYQRQENLLVNREYITEVLGIELPLNESYPYSPNLNERILEEHLILENFLGSLIQSAKKAAGNAKSFYTTVADVIQNPSKIGELIAYISSKVVKLASNNFREIINTIKHIPALQKIAQKLSKMLEGAVQKYNSMKGSWQKLLVGMALGVGLRFLWSKVGKVWENFKERFKEFLTPENISNLGEDALKSIQSQIINVAIDGLGKGVVDKSMQKFTDIKSYLGAIGPIVGGVKFFLDTLAPATGRYEIALNKMKGEDSNFMIIPRNLEH